MFISLEGIDGSGKTTLCNALCSRLKSRGLNCIVSREPGGNPVSEEIRSLLLYPDCDLPLETEILLFLAARSINAVNVLLPALRSGCVVVSDRFCDSLFAYQSYGKGFRLDRLKDMHSAACRGIMPDVTFLLDISVSEALIRNNDADRFTVNRDYLEIVRAGYLDLAAAEPDRIVKINAMLPLQDKLQQILEILEAKGLEVSE